MPRGIRLPKHLTPVEKRAVSEFVRLARSMLGSQLLEIRMFGSRSRGQGTENSDIDLLLVVTSVGRQRRYEVYDLAFDIQLKLGVEVAPMVVEEGRLQELRRRQRRIAQEIDRDGILL
jgi:predicted nucleotidyltransferase